MTYLLQTWNYFGEELGTVKHLSPWGTKDTITSMLSDKKCKNNSVLPLLIKNQIENKSTIKIWGKFLLQTQGHMHHLITTVYFVEQVNQILNC